MLWPYVPVGDITESVEWRTEVIRTKSAEQRIQTRPLPRRTWALRHVWNQDRASAARALLRTADHFYVPDWTRRIYAGPVASGASVVLAADDVGAMAGGYVGIIADERRNEVASIASVSVGQVVLTSVTTARTAPVYLVDRATLAAQLQLTRGAGQHVIGDITFTTDIIADIGLTDRPQYRGHDILDDPIVLAAGQIDESVSWPVEQIDAEIGLIAALKTRTRPDDMTTMRWLARTSVQKMAVRRWLFSRRGKLRAWWRSTWARDLEAAAGIASASVALTVFLPTGAQQLEPAPFDIEISGLGRYRRRVLSTEFGADLNGRRTVVLTLDTALGATHTAGEINRISFLRCLRLDTDRIEFLHIAGGLMEVAAPCIEVPVP